MSSDILQVGQLSSASISACVGCTSLAVAGRAGTSKKVSSTRAAARLIAASPV